MKTHRARMLVATLLGSFALIGGVGLTVSSAWLITMAASHPPILALTMSIVLVRFFGIFRSVARYGERVVSHDSVFRSLTSLRVRLFDSLGRRNTELVRDLNSGDYVKSIVDDVERAQEFQLRVTLPRMVAIITLSMSCLIALWIFPLLLVIILPVSTLLLFILPRFASTTCLQSSIQIEELENLYSHRISAVYWGLSEAKIFGYADSILDSLAVLEREILLAEQRLFRVIRALQLVTLLTLGFAVTSSAWLLQRFEQERDLPSVQIAMGIFLPLVAFEAITNWYPNLYTSGKLLRAEQSVKRISSDVHVETDRMVQHPKTFELSLDAVTASWGKPFMRPVTTSVEPGEVLVLRGKSGAGKSTLALALCGALSYSGRARIGGIEISEFENLSSYVSASLQRGHVFNTTVRENLKIAHSGASDQDLLRVLSLVELEDIPLDAQLGELGRALSGGEIKRLAVARALLSPAPILILDEPTEHLDASLAARIEARITEIAHKSARTVIVITHSGWLNSSRMALVERE